MITRKSIFITGAASGIGRATAIHFAEKGWFVGLFDLNEDGLSDLHQQIGTEKSCFAVTDVTREESVQKAAAFFGEKTGGQMDVLFNSAGILRMNHHHRISIADQRKTVEVNVLGVLHAIHASLPLLKRSAPASIISMSSASAVYGVPEVAVYSATKFAVRGLTEALNIEFEPMNIHVCDVMAPYVQTPMITEAKTQATSVDRLGVRLGPEKVASAVWKAAHRKKVHWKISLFLNATMFGVWLFPFAKRFMVKVLSYKAPQ